MCKGWRFLLLESISVHISNINCHWYILLVQEFIACVDIFSFNNLFHKCEVTQISYLNFLANCSNSTSTFISQGKWRVEVGFHIAVDWWAVFFFKQRKNNCTLRNSYPNLKWKKKIHEWVLLYFGQHAVFSRQGLSSVMHICMLISLSRSVQESNKSNSILFLNMSKIQTI